MKTRCIYILTMIFSIPMLINGQNECGETAKLMLGSVIHFEESCVAFDLRCITDPGSTGGNDDNTNDSVYNEKVAFVVHGNGGDEEAWKGAACYLNKNYKVANTTIPSYSQELNIGAAAYTLRGELNSIGSSHINDLEINGNPTLPNENFIIAHSMGGIVSKNVYKDYYNLSVPLNDRWVGGIATFGTPHLGAEIVDNIDDIKALVANSIPALLKGPILDLVETTSTNNNADPLLENILNTINTNLTDQINIGLNENNYSTFENQAVDPLMNLINSLNSSFLADFILSPEVVENLLNFVSGGSLKAIDFLARGFDTNAAQELSPSSSVIADLNNTNYYTDIQDNAIQFYGVEDPVDPNTNQRRGDAALRLLHSLKNNPHLDGQNLCDTGQPITFANNSTDTELIDLFEDLIDDYDTKMTEYDEALEAGVPCWFDDWIELVIFIIGGIDDWIINNIDDCIDTTNEFEEIFESLGIGKSYLINFNDMFMCTVGGLEIEQTVFTTCVYDSYSIPIMGEPSDCPSITGITLIDAYPVYEYNLIPVESDGVVTAASATGWPTATQNGSPNVVMFDNNHFEMRYSNDTKVALDGLMTNEAYGEVFNVSSR